MEKTNDKKHLAAGLLVRWRWYLLALMAAAALVSALLIPRTRINGDVTATLPEDSPMRRGITILEQYFPAMDIRMQTLRVMFLAEPPADSLETALTGLLNGARLAEVRQHDAHTLYQYMLPADADGKALTNRVQARFGTRAVVEVEDNSGMPDNLVLMLGVGVALVLLILFLMCPSVVEVLLFLLTIGIAVAVNMGTNALLPSVNLLTHTLSAVLQLVLSMDYAIILMNRYRQEKQGGLTGPSAMTAAIAHAAPSILSSGLTTVASLLMLVFMRLKIGADLGIVLSKGVLCSLVATFTVLPALILAFEKGIEATQKKVPRIPTDRLARFESRHRIALATLFAALFIGSWFLQRQTEISYSVVWPTQITKEFPPRNTLLLLYPTENEEVILPLGEQIAALPQDASLISYPSIALKPRTAGELVSELGALSPDLAGQAPKEAVDLIYYAVTHPQRDEKMRLDELQPTADSLLALARQFLPEDALAGIAKRFDPQQIVSRLNFSSAPPPAFEELGSDTAVESESQSESESGSNLELDMDWEADWETEPPVADEAGQDSSFSASQFSYEQVAQQRTAAEMAEILHFDPQQIALVYRIGGVGRKGRPATLNMHEFFQLVSDKVLSNKFYAAMVPKKMAAEFRTAKQEIDVIWSAGPTQRPDAPPVPATIPAALPETDSTKAPAPSPAADAAPNPAPNPAPATPAAAESAPVPPSPLEQLAEMAFSGQRYSSAQFHRALKRAGVSVQKEELDLLYLYHGYRSARDTSTRLSLLEIADFLDELSGNPLIAAYADSAQRARLTGIRKQLDTELGALRSDPWSLAVIATDLPVESEETFRFIDQIHPIKSGKVESYLIGFSQMYKEIKEGFPRELLVLTLLTIAAIFLIIALTFRSALIPLLLIPTVLMAVWLNVAVSGLGDRTMLFLAYLIVQGILMGAAIDYSILFTHYYRDARLSHDRIPALATAYKGAIHTILTSGLILVLAPWIMSLVISDPMIISILRSISAGALAAILLVLFALPATLVLTDRWVVPRTVHSQKP